MLLLVDDQRLGTNAVALSLICPSPTEDGQHLRFFHSREIESNVTLIAYEVYKTKPCLQTYISAVGKDV